MALITCPKCGKQISNTAEKCIHCGYNLHSSSETQPELKQYYGLSAAEQKALRAEFYKTDTAYAECDRRAEKRGNLINISFYINVISDFVWISLIVIVRIYQAATNKEATVFGVIAAIFLLLAAVSLIANCVLRFTFRKCRHNQLIIEKRFQKWLKVEKAISYKVQLTSEQKKDKAFFDEIDVDRTQLEV